MYVKCQQVRDGRATTQIPLDRATRFEKKDMGDLFLYSLFILVHLRYPSFHVQKVSEVQSVT
jgi:hypothetical protein